MDILVFLGVVCVIHAMLLFFDLFFKSCMMLPYLEFMQGSGLSIRLFRLQFYSTRINRSIVKWSSKFPNLYRQSFQLGCYVTMLLLPVALGLLLSSIFAGSSQESNSEVAVKTEDVARLEILLPGVNLPLNQIGYYVIALLICTVVHEAGHGIAAVLEDVPVIGCGLSLIFIVPIAYTEIDSDQLQAAKLMKKLKIYTAGIWNNILLAAFCYGLLLLLPLLLAPFYETSKGVFITKIEPKAALRGENGLYVGDKITEINGCSVTNEEEWLECLRDTLLHHPAYCVEEEFVHDNEESAHDVEHQKDSVSCCPKNPALNCFENADEARLPQFVCLNIRNTVEHSENYCHKSHCPQHSSCLKPILANHSTIIHMKRKNRTKDLVYYGHPSDVLRNVEISMFTPKTKFFEPWFADAIALLLKYLAVFSSGLAMVNVIPCFGLDGQYLVSAVIGNIPNLSKNRKELIANSVNLAGSVILFVAIVRAFV